MKSHRFALGWALASIGVAAVWVGCNQILGNHDDDRLASSTASSSGGGGDDAGHEDGGPADAGHDAHADAPADAPVDAPPLCAMVPPVDGGCAAPRSLCGMGCVNLTCDPANCGACAHDCAGGTCGAGACRPIALLTGENGPEGIAVDDAGIYWADHGGDLVRVMALDGGSPTTIASGQAGPVGVAVTPTHVYWSDNTGGTLQYSLKTSFSANLFATSAGTRPVFLAASATTLYWANQGTTDAGAGAGFEGASLADGGIVLQSDAGGAYPTDVALNGNAVFWTAAAGVYSAPLTGGSGTLAAKDFEGPLAVAVTSTTVYWTNAAGKVQSQPIAGTTQTLLHSGEAKPTGMAVDDTDVYWVDQVAGLVFRAPLGATDQSKTVTVATGQLGPYRIAVDGKFVYWTNNGSGSVVRLAK